MGAIKNNQELIFHNIWPNAFKAVELAFKEDEIGDNLKEVIKMQMDSSPFEDIQIYKYDKKNNKLVSRLVLNDKKPLLGSCDYTAYGNLDCNVKRLQEDGSVHFLNISKYSNKYNNYLMVIDSKSPINNTSELYCEEIIKRTWRVILNKQAYQESIREAYITDPLTNLGNRAYYQEVTRKMFDGGKKDITYSLLDLFRLKYINDNYGHKYGDEYIKRAGEIVNNELDSDDMIFRIGGDEFAIISGRLKRNTMIEKLNEANLKLNKETLGLEIPFPLNINFGVVEGEEDLDTFYTKADARLARQKGKVYRMLNIDRRR